MKAISKKKFPKKADAKKHLEAKYGPLVEHKEHRTRWMFMPANSRVATSVREKSYEEVLADYRKQNPDVPYRDAQAAASAIFSAQKVA